MWLSVVICVCLQDKSKLFFLSFFRVAIVNKAIDNLPLIWALFESNPHTLVHNDCSPRNICLRYPTKQDSPSSHSPGLPGLTNQGSLPSSVLFQDPRTLCMYDWELATVGVAQYDVAEFLCFTLQPSTPPAVWLSLLEFHRQHLEYYSGVIFPPKR